MNTEQKEIVKETTEIVELNGWVRHKRENPKISFLVINSGQDIKGIQVISNDPIDSNIQVGSSVHITGTKVLAPNGKDTEIHATKIELLGTVDNYPLQPKKHGMEFLRSIPHLRARTNTFSAIFRIRHTLTLATHSFFDHRGFYNWTSPILTENDCEGAGETFQVKDTNYHLTVSGQLEAEYGALALGAVYTFGPTFRAENSQTRRHLSEFWMVEPEVAFMAMNEAIALAEYYIKFLIASALYSNEEDLIFLNTNYEKETGSNLIQELKDVINLPFKRMTYTEAINILRVRMNSTSIKYEVEPIWGNDLTKEHEDALVAMHGNGVIITDYPKEIKSFYMKENEDGKTVAAFDILIPNVGELVGGSQREDNYDKLKARTDALGITDSMKQYLDTRKQGSVIHSGFGLGFERMLMFITKMDNIRDVIPFPKSN